MTSTSHHSWRLTTKKKRNILTFRGKIDGMGGLRRTAKSERGKVALPRVTFSGCPEGLCFSTPKKKRGKKKNIKKVGGNLPHS